MGELWILLYKITLLKCELFWDLKYLIDVESLKSIATFYFKYVDVTQLVDGWYSPI